MLRSLCCTVQFLQEIIDNSDIGWLRIRISHIFGCVLQTIRKALLHRTGAVVNLTGDQKTLTSAAAPVREFLAALPEQGLVGSSWQGTLPAQNEAITVPTQVTTSLMSFIQIKTPDVRHST